MDTSKLDNLTKIGWQDVTVQELIKILAQSPPMVPIVVELEDDGRKFFLNDYITDNTDRAPILVLKISDTPKVRENIPETYEEELDRKRHQALAMDKK